MWPRNRQRKRNASRSHPLQQRIILTFIALPRSGHQPLADVLVGDVDAVAGSFKRSRSGAAAWWAGSRS